jgi:hypothetical protein
VNDIVAIELILMDSGIEYHSEEQMSPEGKKYRWIETNRSDPIHSVVFAFNEDGKLTGIQPRYPRTLGE